MSSDEESSDEESKVEEAPLAAAAASARSSSTRSKSMKKKTRGAEGDKSVTTPAEAAKRKRKVEVAAACGGDGTEDGAARVTTRAARKRGKQQ
jgi:hypothetical protein